MKKFTKIALIVASFVLVAALSVGGTLAWLTAKTDVVTNTFTPTGIEIDLIETKKPDGTVVAAGVTDWSAELIPSKEYDKNPVVSVDGTETDVDVYLFVKLEKVGNPDEYLDYTSLLNEDAGWKLVEGQENVYWREVKVGDSTKEWHLIANDKVTVKSTLLEADMPAEGEAVQLKYTAYAIQTQGFASPAAAWTEVSKLG